MTGGIVLAAGEGSRFGGPKQLAQLDGRPLVEHVAAVLGAVCDRVVVVLGAHADEVLAGARLDDVVVCPDWAAGTFASLRCGLAALGDEPDAVVVALGDQPSLSRERIDAVLAAGAPIARATDGGAPSHPVVIRRGARVTPEALRAAAGVELGPLADVDTREQLDALTA
ncbi:MAG: nucleotidyltransferase family protein [Actinobacteria bacterium]|nr:MAG: nucleotidyltransferase family protein [Actinomycetota bacterium]